MHKILSKYPKLALTAGAILMAVGMASVATPTQAAVAARVQHTIDCINWAANDRAQYVANCLPGLTVFMSSSTGSYTDPCWRPPCCHPCCHSEKSFKKSGKKLRRG